MATKLAVDMSREKLSSRELEVLTLLTQGRSNKEIGAILLIGETTVKSHLHGIFAKLNVLSRTEAIAAAYMAGPREALTSTPGPGPQLEAGENAHAFGMVRSALQHIVLRPHRSLQWAPKVSSGAPHCRSWSEWKRHWLEGPEFSFLYRL